MKSGVILMWGESMWNNVVLIKNREVKMYWIFILNIFFFYKNKYILFKLNYLLDLLIINYFRLYFIKYNSL